VAVAKPIGKETIERIAISRDHGGVALIFQGPDQVGKSVIIVGCHRDPFVAVPIVT